MSIDETVSIPELKDFHFQSSHGLVDDHWDAYDKLREEYRFFKASFGPDPIWALTRYEDIHEALQDYELFSNENVTVIDPMGSHTWYPLELDPPIHGLYRKILTPWFTPGAVAELEPKIREWCITLIEKFDKNNSADAIKDFARLYPTTIFMGLMGLPIEDSETLLTWAEELMHTSPKADPDGAIRQGAMLKINDLLRGLVADRTANPRNDIMTGIVTAKVNDQPISPEDIMGIAFLLYMGGLDTVAGALGTMFHHLATNDADRNRIINEPEIIPAAIEEMLRAYSIVNTGRVITRDVDWHGCPMKKGDRVMLPTASANRDETEFPNSKVVDFDREKNRHIAFGAGPHRCLGSYLARAELRIALEEWHKRIPNYRLAPNVELTFHAGGVAGYDSMPLVWD